MKNIKIALFPRTRLGKWSVGLGTAFIILIWLKMQYGIPVISFAIAALGLVGFFTGIVAIFKNKDISILSFLSIFIGLIIIAWIAGEIIYPH